MRIPWTHPAALVAFTVAAALAAVTPAPAQEAAGTVEELRRLNAAVERMTVLMERLVDERRTEVLQRQLAIGNERLAGLETRLQAQRDVLEERRGIEASLASELEELSGPLPGLADNEFFREKRKAERERVEVDLRKVREMIVDQERRVGALEAEAFAQRDRQDALTERIAARLGLAP